MAKPVRGPKEQQKQKHTDDSLCNTPFAEKQTSTLQNIQLLMSALLKYQVTFAYLSHPYGRIHLSSSERKSGLGSEE